VTKFITTTQDGDPVPHVSLDLLLVLNF
jgi:hypothetical protein